MLPDVSFVVFGGIVGSFDDTERFAPDTFPGLDIPLAEVFPQLPEPEAAPDPREGDDER